MALLGVGCLLPTAGMGNEPKAPGTVKELWADFDPRKEALDVKDRAGVGERRHRLSLRHLPHRQFQRQTGSNGGLLRLPQRGEEVARPAAHPRRRPAGLSATKSSSMPSEATPACRSIGAGGKWRTPRTATPTPIGERSIRRRRTCRDTVNLKPGDKYLDPFDSPRNNNWYLLTLGARRGLTFLEQQPEVDADRLGVYGHSMGGNLTVYVAGTDNRVKAAAPSVGGSGFRTEPWPLLPQEKKRRRTAT